MAVGNGLPRTMKLDTDGRVEVLSTPSKHELSVGYFSTGTIAAINDNVYAQRNASFLYDYTDRLSMVGISGDTQYINWDTVGNRTVQAREGQGSYTFTMENQSNRLMSWSGAGKWRNFGYDNVGNLVSESHDDGSRAYTYETFGRMSGLYINGTLIADYRSNAFNQRAYKITGGVPIAIVYGPNGEPLFESTVQTTSYVWLQGQLLGMVPGGSSMPATTTR